MGNLIKLINREIVLGDEAMLIKPIRDMFLEDKSPNKEQFFKYMSYLYFVYDPRSEYYYMDIEDRKTEVIQQEGLPKGFKPPKNLKLIIDRYCEKFNKNSALLLLEDSKIGMNKLREFLVSIDYTEVDDKGKPKYQIGSIVTALDKIPHMAKEFDDTYKLLTKDLEESTRVRGGVEHNKVFENGFGAIK